MLTTERQYVQSMAELVSAWVDPSSKVLNEVP